MTYTAWPAGTEWPKAGLTEFPTGSGYTGFPSAGQVIALQKPLVFGGAPFASSDISLAFRSTSVPSVGLSGQSNALGNDAQTTGWRGADSRVDFYDFYNGGSVTLGPYGSGPPKFGCELTLANGLAAMQSSTGKVWFRKAAVGGTPIDNWVPGGGNNADLRTTLGQMNGHPGVTKHAFIWWQGETDAASMDQPTYFSRLNTLAADVRAHLDAPCRIFVVLLNAAWLVPGGVLAPPLTGPAILAAQLQFVGADSDAVGINLDAFPPPVITPPFSNIHYFNGQQLLIGQVMTPLLANYFGF